MCNPEGTQSIVHVMHSSFFESRCTSGPYDQRREQILAAEGNVVGREAPGSPHIIPYLKWSIVVGHQSASH